MKKKKLISGKTKSLSEKVIAGTLLTTIIGSCIDKNAYNFRDNLYSDPTYGQIDKIDLLNIEELHLSDEFIQYIKIINEIFVDITTDPIQAHFFCEDTEGYLKSKNLFILTKSNDIIDFHLTDRDKKLLLAMTDPDIMAAVENRDFEAFLGLCKHKGYFTDTKDILTINYENYRPFFETDDDYIKFVNEIEKINGKINTKTESVSQSDAYMIGAPIAAVGFGVVEIGVVVDKIAWISAAENSPTHKQSNDPALSIWISKGATITKQQEMLLYDELVENRVIPIVEIIARECPNVDADALQNFLITNFKAYYGIK